MCHQLDEPEQVLWEFKHPETGVPLIRIGTHRGATVLTANTPDGKVGACLVAHPSLTSLVLFRDGAETPQVELFATSRGGEMTISNPDGTDVVSLTGGGMPEVKVNFPGTGETAVSLIADDTGAEVNAYHPDGTPGAALATDAEGASIFCPGDPEPEHAAVELRCDRGRGYLQMNGTRLDIEPGALMFTT